MTSRNKNRWIVNLKLAARELEMGSAKLSRRADIEKCNCRANMKRGNMKDAKMYAEKSVQEITLMENYKQSSKRLKALIVLLQSRSCQDNQIQVHIEGIVRLIDAAMRNRQLKTIKGILEKHGKFLLASIDGADCIMRDGGEAKTLLEEIAKEENIEFEKVFLKKIKSCLSQKSTKTPTKLVAKKLAGVYHEKKSPITGMYYKQN